MEITFRLDVTKATTRLVRIADGVKDLSKPFSGVGDELLRYYGGEVFERQGVVGEAWRELAPSTQRMRLKHWGYYRAPSSEGPERRILIWTGRLREGFRKGVKALSLTIYNDVPYFKYHQQAGGRPKQRRMLALTKDVLELVTNRLNEYIRTL